MSYNTIILGDKGDYIYAGTVSENVDFLYKYVCS